MTKRVYIAMLTLLLLLFSSSSWAQCGNVDGDAGGIVDIGDVTAFSNWLYLDANSSMTSDILGSPPNTTTRLRPAGPVRFFLLFLFFDMPYFPCPAGQSLRLS